MDYVVVAVQSLVAVVFGVSAFSKLRGRAAFTEFVATIRSLKLVPDAHTRTVALAVALVEAAIVVLVVMPPTAPLGLPAAVALLAAFTGAILAAMGRGIQTPCRCFGVSSAAPLGRPHIVRNVVLAVIAGIGALAVPLGESDGFATLHGGGLAIAVVAGVVGGVLVVAFDDLVALFRPAP